MNPLKPIKNVPDNTARSRSSLWPVMLGCLFIVAWRSVVLATHYVSEPNQVPQLAAIPDFEQDLAPNHANTRLIFCQDTKTGVGIYYCDLAAGSPRLLCEQREKGRGWRRFTMLGWAPDDSVFACAWPQSQPDQELILIFDGRTGDRLAQLVADPALYQLAWLSPDTFAYASQTSVRIVKRQSNGTWAHQRSFENVATNLQNLAAVSESSVAWQDNGDLWLFDLGAGAVEKVWTATTNQLTEFAYSPAAGEFLLNCSDDAGQSLIRVKPHDNHPIDLGQISQQPDYVHNARWDRPGTRYAFLINDSAGSAFCLKTGDRPAPVTIPWAGGVHSFVLNGDHLFFAGTPAGQAPGIWEYDLNSATFACRVPAVRAGLARWLGSPSTSGVLTNSLGEQRFFHLWSPPHASPGHKYPLLLAQEFNFWFPGFPMAAQEGCYVAVVDRPFSHTWNGIHKRTWAEDMGGLYEIMARQPTIDTNRVYLYACSMETRQLSAFLAARPALAKGAILFNPSLLPDATSLPNKRLLIVDGTEDAGAPQRLSKFQDEAAREGCPVTLLLQPGTGHVAASGATKANQARQLAQFLVQNP